MSYKAGFCGLYDTEWVELTYEQVKEVLDSGDFSKLPRVRPSSFLSNHDHMETQAFEKKREAEWSLGGSIWFTLFMLAGGLFGLSPVAILFASLAAFALLYLAFRSYQTYLTYPQRLEEMYEIYQRRLEADVQEYMTILETETYPGMFGDAA